MAKHKLKVGDKVLYKNRLSEIIGMGMSASDEPLMYFVEVKLSASTLQEWVLESEIKEINMETLEDMTRGVAITADIMHESLAKGRMLKFNDELYTLNAQMKTLNDELKNTEESKMRKGYKIYVVSDTNTGEVKFMTTKALKRVLIKAILEDVRSLADFDSYESMTLALTKLDIVIMDMEDFELSDIIIHIASEYDYEVYDKIDKKDIEIKIKSSITVDNHQ